MQRLRHNTGNLHQRTRIFPCPEKYFFLGREKYLAGQGNEKGWAVTDVTTFPVGLVYHLPNIPLSRETAKVLQEKTQNGAFTA